MNVALQRTSQFIRWENVPTWNGASLSAVAPATVVPPGSLSGSTPHLSTSVTPGGILKGALVMSPSFERNGKDAVLPLCRLAVGGRLCTWRCGNGEEEEDKARESGHE